MRALVLSSLAAAPVVFTLTCPAAAFDKDALIQSAMSAAPVSVAKDATVVTFDEKMEMIVLRKGSNGWTCMPDNPDSPGNDPECDDQVGFQFVMAWMHHKKPELNSVGFGYMLQGGSDASNEDPFATEPKDGKSGRWLVTGPHIMIYNPGPMASAYPRKVNDPDTSAPYVMWPNTPYEHIMVPVK
jgi:hypothetical protein